MVGVVIVVTHAVGGPGIFSPRKSFEITHASYGYVNNAAGLCTASFDLCILAWFSCFLSWIRARL